MSASTSTHAPRPDDARAVERLYHEMINCWNRRDAACMAMNFSTDATVIGFDGSAMNGREEIRVTLDQIFRDHATPLYVSIPRGVRFPAGDVAIFTAAVGMIPPGAEQIQADLNAIQMLTLVRHDGHWVIESFQNTPAQFHGRPELAEALTQELRTAHADAPIALPGH